MPSDPRKRQKQQERKAAKRKSKRQELARVQHAGLAERLDAAAGYPVLDSWASESLWVQGLGQVAISRALPGNQVAYAIFLVDRYCLGVKDAMSGFVGQTEYESKFVRPARSNFGMRKLSPADVRKLVEEAVQYARGLGIAPHPDYQKARHLFGAIDPAESREVFEFGKNGKPLFIAGPHDTPERCRQILALLGRSRGEGRFDYVLPVSGASQLPSLPGMPMLPLEEEDEDEPV